MVRLRIPPAWWRWGSLPVLLALAIIVGLLVVSAIRILARSQEIRRERQALEREIERLETEKAHLEAAIRALGSAEEVERLAKERLGFKRPGEEVVVVRPQAFEPATTSLHASWQGWGLFSHWLGQLLQFLTR